MIEFFENRNYVKKAYESLLSPVCREHEITQIELDILLFLSNNPQFQTAADIVEHRKLTKSHVSTSLRDLEERGFVRRFLADGNKKSVHIELLPSSNAAVKAGQLAQKKFFSKLFDGFSAEELKQMERNFKRISDNLRHAFEEEDHVD